MIKRILVAIDNSIRNTSVFDTAVSLAQATGAKLMLVHILSEEDPDYPLLPTYAYYAILKDSDGGVFKERFDEYTAGETDFIEKLTQSALAAGVDAEYTQYLGFPGWEICEIASTWSADLILVGSRGFKGLKEKFLGSISNYVTHHAPCSVLVVRNKTDSESYLNSIPEQNKTAKAESLESEDTHNRSSLSLDMTKSQLP